jgi:site-specific DNA recombinase
MTLTAGDIPQALAATAGPAGLIPGVFLGRTSGDRLQDPIASLRRQIRNCQAWLPPGCQITGYYWDVESGGLDLDQRGQSDAWQAAAAAGIPRDGSVADLLTQAKSPTPAFTFVVCEDIERSARDAYSSLRLEKQLADQGIPLFATDEPFNVEGINATMVLVRRVKQGVAEWYRLQLKGKVWDGLKEHSLDGWNIGKVPIGYQGERHPHPNPVKAAEGRVKTRLVPDPVYGPVITTIYKWRVEHKLGKPTIRARLAADPVKYPPPPSGAWSLGIVDEILSNPKYTGHQVMGRRRRKGGKKLWTPPSEWIWTPEPTHEPLVDKATWDAAQAMGRRHGNVRDPEMPTRRPGRRYKYRSRLYCSICHRRMYGGAQPSGGRELLYYRCPHDAGTRRHHTAYPDHPNVRIREDLVAAAVARFFTERVFGPGRAALQAAHMPASAADQAQQNADRAQAIRKQLARIDTAEAALITELETPADPADPAAQALRGRIRARFTELYAQRTELETHLAALDSSSPAELNDPTLLDELPTLADLPSLADIITHAPEGLIERLLAAFDLQATYNPGKHQMTIHAVITDATPQAAADLLADPRADHNRAPAPARPATTQDQLGDLAGHTGSSPRTNTAGCGEAGRRTASSLSRLGGSSPRTASRRWVTAKSAGGR